MRGDLPVSEDVTWPIATSSDNIYLGNTRLYKLDTFQSRINTRIRKHASILQQGEGVFALLQLPLIPSIQNLEVSIDFKVHCHSPRLSRMQVRTCERNKLLDRLGDLRDSPKQVDLRNI